MSKVTYEIIKKDERLFFYDGKQYVLFDSGFVAQKKNNSASVSGTIGPFSTNVMSKTFFTNFINLTMDDGQTVTAVFNPMDGYNCFLEGGKLMITDEEIECPKHEYFFDFVHPSLPLIEGEINGHSGCLFFDTGARMTMFCNREFASSKPLRSYREWMALLRKYDDLSVYSVELAFSNGFSRSGEGAWVTEPQYAAMENFMNILAVLGIDIFQQYDLCFAVNSKRRGIALMKKADAAVNGSEK